jgi:hypothetical protein
MWKDRKQYETRDEFERKSNKYRNTYMENLKELYRPMENAQGLSLLDDLDSGNAHPQGLLFKVK